MSALLRQAEIGQASQLSKVKGAGFDATAVEILRLEKHSAHVIRPCRADRQMPSFLGLEAAMAAAKS